MGKFWLSATAHREARRSMKGAHLLTLAELEI
jgi:hypothetical protein